MMRRSSLAVLTVVAAAVAACGLDALGSLESAPLPTTDSEGGASGAAEGGLVDAEALPEVPVDGGGVDDPIADASVITTDCGVASVADNFNSGIGATWIKTGDAVAVSSGGGGGGGGGSTNGFVRLTETKKGGKKAGLFWVPTVLATSFKATFRYYAQKPSKEWWESSDVGDGFTFVWLTSGGAADLVNANDGHTLAIPRGVKGAAFAFDAYRNNSINDPSPPAFSLLKIDSARGDPGSYDWHLASRGPYTGVYDAWRDVVITFAAGTLSASVATTPIFTNEPVPGGTIRAIGFTASTGGANGVGFFVDSPQIVLTDPSCP